MFAHYINYLILKELSTFILQTFTTICYGLNFSNSFLQTFMDSRYAYVCFNVF